jgi:predicted Zn-dependent protease
LQLSDARYETLTMIVGNKYADVKLCRTVWKLWHTLTADSSAARQNGYKVIVIDAAFPPTMTKSALGVALSDAQLQQR